MPFRQLTIDQIEQLNQISDPVARRRYGVLFQLPQDLQDSFESEVTTNSVWSIAKEKYDLSIGKIGAVARIIGLVFLGELPIKNFIVALQRDLNVDMKTAQAIAQDINLAIFQPVRESLMLVHNITERGLDNTNTRINAPALRSSEGAKDGNDSNGTQNSKSEKGQTLKPEFPRSDLENSNSQKLPLHQDYAGRASYKLQDSQLRPDRNRDYDGQARQARPAVLRMIPNKNVLDLRLVAQGKKKHSKKNRHDGFFSA